MTNRLMRGAFLAATAFAAFAAPASAQQIDRIVAFGDSYADTGILRQTIIADAAASNNPPGTPGELGGGIKYLVTNFYSTGRFSGGTNYIDSLSDLLGVPVANFAVGGALATTFPNGASNTNCGPGGPNGGSPASCPLGLTYQVDQFLNVGTQNTLFPNIAPAFDEGDLLTVSIGGNDARYYQQYFSALPVAPFITSSVGNATIQLDRLVAAGAPTISFLAGDTGRLPEVLANPAAAAIRTNYSTQFNTAMQSVLAGYAADGVMVHYLDLNLVLDNILASPASYGIVNGTAASNYTCPAPTSTVPGCLLNASGYLFYFDGLHLTSDGFNIVAQYVQAQLTAPLTLQATADVGMDTALQFGRTMTARMDLSSPRDGDMPEGLKFFLVGDTTSRSLGETESNQAFKVTSVGATAGAQYGFGSGVVGLAVNYSRPRAGFDSDDAKVKSDSLQLGAYASAGIGGGFVQGYLGYGKDNHDLTRYGVVITQTGETDGDHWLAGAKAGYLVNIGSFRAGPVVAVDYAKANVDGYTESGDAALTLNVDRQSFKAMRGSIGIEARGDMGGNGVQFRPYGSLVLEKDLITDSRSIAFSQTSAPGIVNSFDFEDVSDKAYPRATGGFSARILSAVTLGGSVSMTFGKDQGNETSANVGLAIGL